ncbi:MAG: iron-containing alcohol dehydrogenase, partial [Megasphaera micronuciformis]|nr:iron-containing alcohol dehydrogenase [Megasphaera micronuciformis]
MLELGLHTAVYRYDTCCAMAADLKVREDDVLLTNRYIYGSYFENLDLPCQVLLKDDYDDGEPTDEVVEAVRRDMIEHPKRIIAVGGGAILDVAKFLSLKECIPLTDLFDGTVQPCKGSELILVPSTCGTGSEVTNVAVVSLV